MLTDDRLTAIREGAHGNGCGVCLTFAEYPAEHQPGCDACIFASREGAAILEELQAARKIVDAVVRSTPTMHIEAVYDSGDNVTICRYCGHDQEHDARAHYDGCLYVQARALRDARHEEDQA